MRRALVGKRVARAWAADDPIVNSGVPTEAILGALEGRTVSGVGRKGKFWWLELDATPWLFGHLGMNGWVRELDAPTIRLHSHGQAPLDGDDGLPRFLKLLIEAEDGRRIAMTDSRRFARLWLGNSPAEDRQITQLGPDAFTDLVPLSELKAILARRKAPIKAVLLDQGTMAGVGNWIADESLYQARISPKRLANTLKPKQVAALRAALAEVIGHAVEVDADYTRFPDHWMFAHRWGGGRGAETLHGRLLVRETIAGRTTAWVPEVQK